MTIDENSFRPTASLEVLRQRSELISKIRNFFELREFIHVETPLVSRDTVVDRYIEPVTLPSSSLIEGEFEPAEMFLQTSPEFAMKRLLASGATAIYQICKAFRKGERGRFHNPEFTMLEWYRVGDNLEKGMLLLADFAEYLFGVTSIQQTTYRDAFVVHASLDPFECDARDVRKICKERGVDVTAFNETVDLDSWLNLAMSEIVEPELGKSAPEIVYHWPASQSALAKVCSDSNGCQVAERFELFYHGTELANGYHELQDADELLRRNEEINQQRVADGNQTLPVESRMLNAMSAGLPQCSGVALGVDRLMMVMLQKSSIEEVTSFPIDQA